MYRFQSPSVETQIVTAFFETGALSYPIARGTTLEQFSGQIARLAQLQQTWPVAVSVRFEARGSRPDILPAKTQTVAAAVPITLWHTSMGELLQ